MNLHPNCMKAYKEKLVSYLSKIEVTGKSIPVMHDFEAHAALNNTFPKENLKELIEIVGPSPSVTLIFDSLQAQLGQKFKYDPDDAQTKLSSLPGFEDIEAVASGVIELLQSLPRSYSMFVALALKADCGLPALVEISKSISLFVPSKEFIKEFPPPPAPKTTLAALLDPTISPGAWDEKVFYLRVDFEGYVSKLFAGTTYQRCAPVVKSYLGLGLGYELFKLDEITPAFAFAVTPETNALIFERAKTGISFLKKEQFPRAEAEAISKLILHEKHQNKSAEYLEEPLKTISNPFNLGDKGLQLRRALAGLPPLGAGRRVVVDGLPQRRRSGLPGPHHPGHRQHLPPR
ncbi:MAG: hypothetical protein J0M12_16220, partial [Deltaproteobacteria bacterium]|nr:hypothetical protein [Deltaproteobacteria bacterium]